MTQAIEWYYGREGQQRGPVNEMALRELAATGQLAPSDLVWCAGMTQWAPAQSVLNLFPQPGSVPPPIPPAGAAPPYAPISYATATPPPIGESAGMRMLLPVGRSGWAIAAGYLGLFSVLMIFAPIALIVSIIAIRDIKKNPGKHGMGRAIFGLIMGVLFTGLLVVFLIAIVHS